MSEKVKLTREQAEAIKSIRGDINGGFTPGNIRTQLKKQWMSKPYATLNELPFEQFIVAVLGDYEVEGTFEVGDCVVLDDGQIVEIIEDGSCTVVVGWIINRLMYRDQINKSLIKRHATKQERWWAKHGREVWELRRNDLVSDKDGCSYTINLIKKDYVEFVEFGMRKKVKEIKESFKVICFAEDRKDVDHA